MIYSHVAIGWFSCGESSTNKPTRGKRTSMGGTDLKITQGHPMSHLIYTLEHVWMKWFGVSASWTEKHILNFTSRPSLSFGKTDLHRIYDGPTQMPPFRSPRPYCRFTSCHHVYIYIYLNTCMYTHVIILYLHMIAYIYIYNININKYVN